MSTREQQLVDAFVRVADTLVADYDVVELLQQLVEDCVELLGVSSAGLLLGDQRGALRVVASTSENTRLLELVQLQVDEGPCLDAFTTGTQVAVPELRETTQRWPRFAPSAVAAGFRSVHAVPLRLRSQGIGALNLFGTEAGALDPADLAVAQALADVATIGVLQHRVAQRSELLTAQLQTALDTRVVIEQAKGVLAERGGVTVEEAFQRLRSYSRRSQRKLTDVARAVVAGDAAVADLIGDRVPPGNHHP